jgi:hypothetical protein
MSASQEENEVESLREWIRELLIKNQQLRIALAEVKTREQVKCVERHVSSN